MMVSRSGQAARFSEDAVRSMGRDTSGVRGMNVSQKGNAVLAMAVARDDEELLVVTENGYGKRTPIADYPVKGRGTMGVKTIALTENKGALAGALVVREHQELVFISQNGMVQRTSVRGINRYGRSSQGVRLMNLRDDDQVSAVALVVESEAATAAAVAEEEQLPLDEAGPDDRRRLRLRRPRSSSHPLGRHGQPRLRVAPPRRRGRDLGYERGERRGSGSRAAPASAASRSVRSAVGAPPSRAAVARPGPASVGRCGRARL